MDSTEAVKPNRKSARPMREQELRTLNIHSIMYISIYLFYFMYDFVMFCNVRKLCVNI
jgi:hypothetical protein